MALGGSLNLPVPEDQALGLLHDMAVASMTGNASAMQQAVHEWTALSPTDKKRIEDIVAMMPYPGLIPMQVQAVFSDPEQFIGAIGRLGVTDSASLATTLAGATASSIVLAAVLSWLQTENKVATPSTKKPGQIQTNVDTRAQANVTGAPKASYQSAKADLTTKMPTMAPLSISTGVGSAPAPTSQGSPIQGSPSQGRPNEESPSEESPTIAASETVSAEDNPINAALQAYIASGTTSQPIDAAQSLQFLRSNPILLASLTTVDPGLLTKAYQIAESQIVIGILDRIIQMQDLVKQEKTSSDPNGQQAPSTPAQQVLTSIRDGIKTNEIPISQSVVMAMQLLLVTSGTSQIATSPQQTAIGQVAMLAPVQSFDQPSGNLVAITSPSEGLQTAKILFPHDTVATSVLVSIPTLYSDDFRKLQQPDLLAQLAVLASVYIQMVPYWSIPAAVSYQAASGKITEKSVTQAAVRAYALAVTALISDPAFTQLVKNFILKASGDLTPEQLTAYIAAIKCTMLVNALVAVYMTMILRKTTGQFNAKELADLILGKVALPPDSLESGLIKQIQSYLKDIPKQYHEAFIYQLLMSYDKNSNVATLIDPAKQFLRLCDQSIFRNTTASESV